MPTSLPDPLEPGSPPLIGGVELGGTKVVCVAGYSPAEVVATDRVPTGDPDETLAWVVERLTSFQQSFGRLAAVGVASFGPLDLDPGSPGYGGLLATPKPGWSGAAVSTYLHDSLAVPVAIASDVEGAALAEGSGGAAAGAHSFVYLTVGTGIGAGVVAGGRLVRGVLHPEVGHIGVPRVPGDAFAGLCPFHGDCLEGMASGPAIAARWGVPAEQLAGGMREQVLRLEATYLAYGLRAITYSYAPQRIVVGGGVGLMPGLLPLVQEALAAQLAGYPGVAAFSEPEFVAPAALGAMAGPVGALILAQGAASQSP